MAPIEFMMPSNRSGQVTHIPPVQVNKSLYPYCVVWSPLPCITWFFPFIGHMGIANSRGIHVTNLISIVLFWFKNVNCLGIIHDFAGPYTIGVGDFAFGAPTRYMLLQPDQCFAATWDEGVESGSAEYSKRMHNLCCDNCHSHVARCLNDMKYKSSTNWGMIRLGVMMFFFGKFTGVSGFIKSYLPFGIILCVVLYFTGQFSWFEKWSAK